MQHNYYDLNEEANNLEHCNKAIQDLTNHPLPPQGKTDPYSKIIFTAHRTAKNDRKKLLYAENNKEFIVEFQRNLIQVLGFELIGRAENLETKDKYIEYAEIIFKYAEIIGEIRNNELLTETIDKSISFFRFPADSFKKIKERIDTASFHYDYTTAEKTTFLSIAAKDWLKYQFLNHSTLQVQDEQKILPEFDLLNDKHEPTIVFTNLPHIEKIANGFMQLHAAENVKLEDKTAIREVKNTVGNDAKGIIIERFLEEDRGIQENPYPDVFKDRYAFTVFSKWIEKSKEDREPLAISFIYHWLKEEGLLTFKDKSQAFVLWANKANFIQEETVRKLYEEGGVRTKTKSFAKKRQTLLKIILEGTH